MHIIDIDGNDEFELESVTYLPDADGKKRIVCNYCLLCGPKGSLKITFEGFAKDDKVRIKHKFKFKILSRMFDDRRIYFQGVKFLDKQFEKNA